MMLDFELFPHIQICDFSDTDYSSDRWIYGFTDDCIVYVDIMISPDVCGIYGCIVIYILLLYA